MTWVNCIFKYFFFLYIIGLLNEKNGGAPAELRAGRFQYHILGPEQKWNEAS